MCFIPNTLTEREKKDGWKLLFDGTTMSAWRGYKMADMPAEWSVLDGTLTKVKTTDSRRRMNCLVSMRPRATPTGNHDGRRRAGRPAVAVIPPPRRAP